MDVLDSRKVQMWHIGVGSIYCSRVRVGSSGRVYVAEINRDYLKYISARAERERNVRTVLGKDDPFPPQQSVDAVLILKTYHEIAQPVRLLKHLRQSMRSVRGSH